MTAHPASLIDVPAQWASQWGRIGWYLALNRLVEWRASQIGSSSTYKPRRPVPRLEDLLVDRANLIAADTQAVRNGAYPAMTDDGLSMSETIGRVRSMLADLPSALNRKASGQADSARAQAENGDLPDYFVQDFHFQTGGYLTDESARLYDTQVETLFFGAAGPMRRSVLRAVVPELAGRDQRKVALLDVACGTGRLLRQMRLTFSAMKLTGLDLSAPYLDEAARQLSGLRGVRWISGNAEAIPLPDASQDIVTSTFLFHELPPTVRRAVTSEISRVLKPGGLFVFLDSLQLGDKPGWDGLLEAFPVRFHEPYYRHYIIDDLAGMFETAGLAVAETSFEFLSRRVICRKI